MSTASLATITIEDGRVVYDADMPIGALRSMLAASESGDMTTLIEAFSTFVEEWPYEGDPKDLEAWDKLRRSQFTAIINGISEHLGSLGEA